MIDDILPFLGEPDIKKHHGYADIANGNAFGGDNHANRIPQLYQFADPWRLAVRMEEHDL